MKGAGGERSGAEGGLVVTRRELARLLKVSVCTVDRMVKAGELKPLGGWGWLVRFYLPDVVECLRNGNRKFGRRAALPGPPAVDVTGDECRVTRGVLPDGHRPPAAEVRNPKSEIRKMAEVRNPKTFRSGTVAEGHRPK